MARCLLRPLTTAKSTNPDGATSELQEVHLNHPSGHLLSFIMDHLSHAPGIWHESKGQRRANRPCPAHEKSSLPSSVAQVFLALLLQVALDVQLCQFMWTDSENSVGFQIARNFNNYSVR
jgi:hypothetical protein